METDRLLAAFENCADESIGLKLLAALRASPTLTSLRVDSISRRIAKQPATVKAKAEELYKIINVDLAKQRQRIEEILPLVAHADARRGQLVFARSKVACITCHQFGYVGGHIGPDLTRVGGIRSERDILEAIMFPSLSFVRSFEPMQVVTKNGRVYNGLVRKDAPDEIVLIASATETVHVPREEIEELRPSTVSIMPAGLDKQLTPAELAESCRISQECELAPAAFLQPDLTSKTTHHDDTPGIVLSASAPTFGLRHHFWPGNGGDCCPRKRRSAEAASARNQSRKISRRGPHGRDDG